ncbi:YqaA family protein [Methanococcus aeolicus]|uniref:YqaA family protein n=1 Tax=Methanococcus aeolicus TaxID=42879 RepID=UPI0021C6CB90|nr:hypothetical protein [Methanococcus aeolicus]UXM85078.1 hypothetical protein N6C89_02010 [Methanococcus aeolicus]
MDLYPVMQNIVNNYGYLGIFLVSFTEAFIQPIPPDIFIMGAPMFGLSPIYSAIVASIGTLFGGLFGYFLGDRLGHPTFSRLFGKKIFNKRRAFF